MSSFVLMCQHCESEVKALEAVWADDYGEVIEVCDGCMRDDHANHFTPIRFLEPQRSQESE